MPETTAEIIKNALALERDATRLAGLAFPVIRVRFAGPTDHRGARWIASYRGTRVTVPFHTGPDSPTKYAARAAYWCWLRHRAEHLADLPDDGPRVMIPGDAGPDEYAYLAVPERFLT